MNTKIFILTSTFLWLNLLDILTTMVLLSLGGIELNPFLQHTITAFDISLKMGLSLFLVLVAQLSYRMAKKRNSITGIQVLFSLLIALDIFYSLVVINNIRQLSFQIQAVRRELHL
jgi:hypothetical protein